MKKVILIFSIIAFTVSCKNNSTKKVEEVIVSNDSTNSQATNPQNILGSYVGNFGDNKMTILISTIKNDTIEGRSIVGGNDRAFFGTIKAEGKTNIIQAKEPGGDKHDGEFNFHILSSTPNELSGSWKPYKPTNTIQEKVFSLNRKAFKYDNTVGQYPEASSRLMKDDEVNNLIKSTLQYMINEIFARHGYCFKKKETRQQFETQDWYIPKTTEPINNLTDIEKKNIALIKKYEKYANEFGDAFSR